MKTLKVIIYSYLILLSSIIFGFSQNNTRVGIGFLPTKNTAIFGLSLGLFSLDNPKVVTIGSRVEILGAGILVPLSPGLPEYSDSGFVKKIDKRIKKGERVYGLDFALSGSAISGEVIGLSIGAIGGSKTRMKGLMIHGLGNIVEDLYGGQFAIWFNMTSRLRGVQIGMWNMSQKSIGLQIGLVNKTEDLSGFQIGLWNKNNKRSLPLINWDF